MTIRVDGEASPVACEPTDQVGDVMARLLPVLLRTGRIAVSIRVAGREVTGPELESLHATSVAEAGALDVVTAPSLRVAGQTLRGLAASLPALGDEQDDVVATLQAGRAGEVMAAFRACIDLWQRVQETLRSAMALLAAEPGGRFLDLLQAPGPIVEAGQALSAALQSVRNALQSKDFTALGDAIEGDLTPLVGRWRDLLSTLIQRIEAVDN